MNALPLDYLLKLTLIWGVLLSYYALLLGNNVNWRLRRRFLLFAWAGGLVIPLLPAWPIGSPIDSIGMTQRIELILGGAAGRVTTVATATEAGWSWQQWLWAIWGIGALLAFFITVVQLLRYSKPRSPRPRPESHGYPVIRSPKVRSPYAAFGQIYLPEDLDPDLERSALLHEAAHLRHGHHRERLLLQIGNVLLWWHPLQWLLARSLTQVHEFQADASVADQVPVRTYGLQLLNASLAPALVPGLFSSPLKKRIMMLTQKKTRRGLRGGQWLVLLLLVTGLVVSCVSENDEPRLVNTEGPELDALFAGIEGANIAPGEQVLAFTLDDLANSPSAPKLESGKSVVQGIYETVRYPHNLRGRGQTGVVSAEVRITKEGQVFDVQTVKQGQIKEVDNAVVIIAYSDNVVDETNTALSHNDFGAEVQRTLASLGPFEPARLGGEPVAASLQVNFQFKLEN